MPRPSLHFGCHGHAVRGRLENEAQDPLALGVERARRHEPEALVEAVRTTLGDHVWLVKSSVAPCARMSSTTRSTIARPMPRPW